MKHGSLFSGIGGFDLAAEWAGWTNVFHCEYNPFGQRVLKYYWPNSISYGDIKQTDFTIHRGEIDVLSGGFPCQPFSSAGKRKGTEDDRHLWPEMLRAIREISPRFVVGENVRGFTNWNGGMVFDQVQADLEAEGYEVLPFLLPACAVNAPHRRDRIWIVAHRTGIGLCDNGTRKQLQPTAFGTQQRMDTAIENRNCDRRDNIGGQAQSSERGFWESGTGDSERVRLQEGTTANTESLDALRRGESRDKGNESNTEVRPRFRDQLGSNGKKRPTPDTGSIELQRGIRTTRPKEAERYPLRGSTPPPGWQDFPTQPPIRQRNDGLSPELDGITVSRHRKESIMAYGNAIVPQVAFEIFKVINAMNKNPQ